MLRYYKVLWSRKKTDSPAVWPERRLSEKGGLGKDLLRSSGYEWRPWQFAAFERHWRQSPNIGDVVQGRCDCAAGEDRMYSAYWIKLSFYSGIRHVAALKDSRFG